MNTTLRTKECYLLMIIAVNLNKISFIFVIILFDL